MNWNTRYANEVGEQNPYQITPMQQLGHTPGNAFLSRNGNLFTRGKRSGLWVQHDEHSIRKEPHAITFVHPYSADNQDKNDFLTTGQYKSEHPIQGWIPLEEGESAVSNPGDRVGIVIHRCDDESCNNEMLHHLNNLGELHRAAFGSSKEAWHPAYEAAVHFTDALIRDSHKHFRESQSAHTEEDQNNVIKKYMAHINTVNSIWGKPLNTVNQKYNVSPDEYYHIHAGSEE